VGIAATKNKLKHIYTFFDTFKNIYLIDSNNPTTTVKTAKKVKVNYNSAF